LHADAFEMPLERFGIIQVGSGYLDNINALFFKALAQNAVQLLLVFVAMNALRQAIQVNC